MSANTHDSENKGEQPSFYSTIKNYVTNVWSDYSNYITFSLSFVAARAFTPIKSGETMTIRLLEGGALAIIAARVEYGVINQRLKDYSWSYLPVIGLYLFKQNPLNVNNNVVNLVIASGGMALANQAWQASDLSYVIIPTVSYAVCGLNHVPKPLAVGLSIATTVIDVSSNYNENHASWMLAGALVSNSIAHKLKINPLIGLGVGGAIGAILSRFEPVILDQLFTPDHFKKSYDVVNKFVDQDEFNLALQHYLIYTVNMEIFLGFFGNYLIRKGQELDNQVVAIGNEDNLTMRAVEFKKFVVMSVIYVFKTAISYTTLRLVKLSIDTYNKNQMINSIQKNLLFENLLIEDNFIQGAKSNYTEQAYLTDIATLADDFESIKSSVFGLPKIIQIGNIDLFTAGGLAAIILIDSVISKIFTYIARSKQEYENQMLKCSSAFDQMTVYDKENAITISQKYALNYTRKKWGDLEQCQYDNSVLAELFSNLDKTGTSFYTSDVLYKAIYILVGYLLNEGGTIQKNELFLYAKALEETTNAILFKSKHIAINENVESAVTRLSELAKLLDTGDNTIAKISYEIDETVNTLTISNLNFTRGNQEKQIHLYVDGLKLYMGKIYAVTGENGAGKSSITTLLKYVFDHIADPSFNVTSGHIIYPGNSIAMIPQKDYIPFNSSLIDIILHPDQATDLTPVDENKIIELINALQVFRDPFTSKELYVVKDDLRDMSGGQKKKLFMIKPLVECPKVLVADETFGPLDPSARSLLMTQIKNSCLNESIIFVVWHQNKNEDNTSCVRDKFFDYELHVQNETIVLGEVAVDCFH